MASSSTHPTPATSSSSSTHRRKYEVFLSFRGADTRYGFADTLYHAMNDKGIVVFREEEDLELGEEINPALKRAMEESKYAVVIVSEQFANSKACLFELTVIMECRRMGRLNVFPVFYKVDASDVGNLTNDFGDHFAKLDDNPKVGKEQWEKWRSILVELGESSMDPKLDENLSESCGRALKELTNLRVRHVKNCYETPVAREIIAKIYDKLAGNSSSISEPLIGTESQEQEIMKLLNIPDPVRVVGICGLPGIGKTILAEVIYNKVSPQFDGRCFIRIGNTTEPKDLVDYQKKLIYGILRSNLGEQKQDDYEVKKALRNRLRERKVFIVLDDVWHDVQVKELAESLEWFGYGSKIIITSRHRNLRRLRQDNVYEVQPLNEKDAFQLFCLKAFNQHDPKAGFGELAAEITSHTGGLPLALNTFGSHLAPRLNKDFWYGYLKELSASLEDPVSKTLVKILEELAPKHRELLLDIVYFFNGYLEFDFKHILEAFDYNLSFDLEVLKDKSLIRLSNEGEWLMHDIIVEEGQKFDKRSRLIRLKDITRELKINTIMPKENPDIKGIVLQLPLPRKERFSLEALSTMINLRVLKIGKELYFEDGWHPSNVEWLGKLLKLSKELCIMEWMEYPLKSLPTDSNFGIKLVQLKLHWSYIEQLWVGKKSFPELKHLQLTFLHDLEEIPDSSGIPNLEILHVSWCKNLSILHRSFGNLKLLKKLLVIECESFHELPNEIISKSLEVLRIRRCKRVKQCPNIPHSLRCLRLLDIRCTSIKELPFSSKRLPSLEEFYAYHAGLEELPSFILSPSGKLKSLCVGVPESCPSFRFPTSFLAFSSLQVLGLSGPITSNEARPLNLSGLSSLQYLHVAEDKFTEILDFVDQVPNLCGLHLSNCDKVKNWSEAQFSNLRFLEELSLYDCNLKAIPESIDLFSALNELNLWNNSFTKLPDSIRELAKLVKLDLKNCTSLESLPKLPLSLQILCIENCPKLVEYERGISTQISVEMLRKNNHCFTVAYVGLDGKPYKVLYLHPKSPLCKSKKRRRVQPWIVCGPAQESPNLGLLPFKSTDSNGSITIAMDWNDSLQPWSCALFIIYEVKRESKKRKVDEPENSDAGPFQGSNCILPEFVCQVCEMQVDKERQEDTLTFVVCVPEAAHLGSSYGVWVFINLIDSFGEPERIEETESTEERERMEGWSYSASIKAGNENVELKKCWACLMEEGVRSKFFREINQICRPALDSESLADSLKCILTIKGPISEPYSNSP